MRLKRGKHLATEVEETLIAHVVVDARCVVDVYRVPIDSLVIEEAIVLINNCPQCIEIGMSVVFEVQIVIDKACLQLCNDS